MHYNDILKFPNLRLIHSLRIQNLRFLFKKKHKNWWYLILKKTFTYYKKKGSDLCFSEKYRLVFISRKFSDLYLMKIQICFYM